VVRQGYGYAMSLYRVLLQGFFFLLCTLGFLSLCFLGVCGLVWFEKDEEPC